MKRCKNQQDSWETCLRIPLSYVPDHRCPHCWWTSHTRCHALPCWSDLWPQTEQRQSPEHLQQDISSLTGSEDNKQDKYQLENEFQYWFRMLIKMLQLCLQADIAHKILWNSFYIARYSYLNSNKYIQTTIPKCNFSICTSSQSLTEVK